MNISDNIFIDLYTTMIKRFQSNWSGNIFTLLLSFGKHFPIKMIYLNEC